MVSLSHLLFVDPSRLCLRYILGQVHCSFETDFYGHIMFTFNAEHFYFLHDLISSYIKEKDRSKFWSNVALESLSCLLAQIEDKSRQRPAGGTTAQAQNIDLPPLDGRSKWWCSSISLSGCEMETAADDQTVDSLRQWSWTVWCWLYLTEARLSPCTIDHSEMGATRCNGSMWTVHDNCPVSFVVFLLPERFKERCLKQWYAWKIEFLRAFYQLPLFAV